MKPQKLNPADQFTLMMDSEIRKAGLAGNICAIILELEAIPDADTIEAKCQQFAQRYPLASARLRATGRQFEWVSEKQIKIPFYQHTQTAERTPEQASAIATDRVADILNKTVPLEEVPPLEIHLLSQGKTCQLILRWFHPICDAKGAELVLHHLFQDQVKETGKEVDAMAQLFSRWTLWEKIKLGFKARKNIQSLDKQSSILPPAQQCTPDQTRTKVICFSEQETMQVLKLARQYAGLTGISLYFIGCMMRALEHTGTLEPGDAYCVPYAMNLRRRKSLFPIFSNQVSFLFAQASRNIVASRSSLFDHLREQNKNAIKQKLDRAMLPLMQAGSWLTLENYGKTVRYTPEGRERSSFWFSYTGDMDPEITDICGCSVSGMHQFSQVTAPPSLGLLVNHFQNKIVLSYNYVNNQLDPDWLESLIKHTRDELLEMPTK